MRIQVDLWVERDEIPKDKNRIILSLLKTVLKDYDEDYYQKIYREGGAKRKKFTFALYMPNCKFNKDTITIQDNKITLYFSTGDLKTGLIFANAFIKAKGKNIRYMDFELKINGIHINQDKQINQHICVFKTNSPIAVREHNQENNRDWYHDISTKEGMELFIKNLKVQILEDLPEAKYDIGDLSVELIKNKCVKVKHYSIEILSNLATLKIEAKPYILKYLYDMGVGSLKSGGFGMLNLL